MKSKKSETDNDTRIRSTHQNCRSHDRDDRRGERREKRESDRFLKGLICVCHPEWLTLTLLIAVFSEWSSWKPKKEEARLITKRGESVSVWQWVVFINFLLFHSHLPSSVFLQIIAVKVEEETERTSHKSSPIDYSITLNGKRNQESSPMSLQRDGDNDSTERYAKM